MNTWTWYDYYQKSMEYASSKDSSGVRGYRKLYGTTVRFITDARRN